MANTTTEFELDIRNYPPTERGLMGAPAYRLRQNYLRGMLDPAAHDVALANPEHVAALERNNQYASFMLITIQ